MPQIEVRYAKSLLELAVEKGQLDTVYADMRKVLAGCRQIKDLQVLLKSPLIKTDKKIKVFKAIFKGQVCTITEEFIILITKNRRESYLEGISEQFIIQYKEKKNIITATVTSAIGLDDAIRKKIMDILKKWYKAEIEIVEKVDPKLIGGFVLRIGNKEADMSILRQLNQLKKDFNKSYLLN
jgi:F-type H+-transporting ATPase subunit delta